MLLNAGWRNYANRKNRSGTLDRSRRARIELDARDGGIRTEVARSQGDVNEHEEYCAEDHQGSGRFVNESERSVREADDLDQTREVDGDEAGEIDLDEG